MSDWQPIETAPTDEIEVLLWATKATGEIYFEKKDFVCVGVHRYGCWWSAHTDCYGIDVDATHWMPLPTPPITNPVIDPPPST